MADTLQNSYLESQLHSAVIFQRGKEVIDYELNEMQDIQRVLQYRAFKEGNVYPLLAQLCVSNDDGYQIVGTNASLSVTVKAGRLWVDGFPIPKAADSAFSGFTANAAGNPRYDVVYAEVTEQEITDPHMLPQLGETTKRRQVQVTVKVVEGVAAASPVEPSLPADTAEEIWQGGIRKFKLARVLRPAGTSLIPAGNVTDLRKKGTPFLLADMLKHVSDTVFDMDEYGAIDDNAFDNFSVFQTVNALADAVGGTVVFPGDGVYKFSNILDFKENVSYVGGSASTRLVGTDTTKSVVRFTAQNSFPNYARVENLQFYHSANSALPVSDFQGAVGPLQFVNVVFGDGTNSVGAVLRTNGSAAKATFTTCRFIVAGDVNGVALGALADFTFNADCEFVMPSTYGNAGSVGLLNVPVNAHVRLTDVYFNINGHNTGASARCVFIAGGTVLANNVRYDDNMGGQGATGFYCTTSSGTQPYLSTSNCHRMTVTYVQPLRFGSRIEGERYGYSESTGAAPTVPDGVGIYVYEGTSTVPTFLLPGSADKYSELRLIIRNNSGGNWGPFLLNSAAHLSTTVTHPSLNIGFSCEVKLTYTDVFNIGTFQWVVTGIQ